MRAPSEAKLKEYTAAVKEKLSRFKHIFQGNMNPARAGDSFDAARDDALPLRSELFSAMQMAAHGRNIASGHAVGKRHEIGRAHV